MIEPFFIVTRINIFQQIKDYGTVRTVSDPYGVGCCDSQGCDAEPMKRSVVGLVQSRTDFTSVVLN